MKAAVDITMPCRAWSTVAGVRALCRRAAAAALAAPGPKGRTPPRAPVGLSILLADDATLRELNRRFRGIDKPTNVLSFPAGDDAPEDAPQTLGDVAIGFETCAAEAARDGKPAADHLVHLVVHGVLHLRGYDHERDPDAEVMERLEASILAGLGVADPYAGELAEVGELVR